MMISEGNFEILVNTAEMFGIDNYKIIYSERPMAYAYCDPGMAYCMEQGLAYGYGIQVLPSAELENMNSGLSKLNRKAMMRASFITYRPIVEDDNKAEVLASCENGWEVKTPDGNFVTAFTLLEGEDFEYSNRYEKFEYQNWYLIPVDENGNEVLENSYYEGREYNVVEAAGEGIYCWQNSGKYLNLTRESFKNIIKLSNDRKFNYEIQESNVIIPYALTTSSLSIYGDEYIQYVPTQDYLEVYDLQEAVMRIYEDEKLAKEVYESWIVSEMITIHNNDNYTDVKIGFGLCDSEYYIVPVDEEGKALREIVLNYCV